VGRPINGGFPDDSAATPNGRSWPRATIHGPGVNGWLRGGFNRSTQHVRWTSQRACAHRGSRES